MPCTDGGPDSSSNLAERDAMLCAVLTVLDKSGQVRSTLDAVNWPETGMTRIVLERWWLDHQQKDRERIEREKQAANIGALRRAALAKLTPDERAAISRW